MAGQKWKKRKSKKKMAGLPTTVAKGNMVQSSKGQAAIEKTSEGVLPAVE